MGIYLINPNPNSRDEIMHKGGILGTYKKISFLLEQRSIALSKANLYMGCIVNPALDEK
jgi:hypothetical protein